MPFDYEFSDKLKDIIQKLRRQDSRRTEILHKKVKQIINSDELTIEHYKNLKYGFSGGERGHHYKSFLLAFKY